MAKDPYKYFRVEARELLDGLMQGILQLERGTQAPDVVPRLLRLAHTLKGAARVVRQPGIAELAHLAENILTSQREPGATLSTEQGSELLRLLDQMTSLLVGLESPSEPAREIVSAVAVAALARPSTEEPLETLRVEMSDIESLLRAATEAGVKLGGVRKQVGAVSHLRDSAQKLLDLLPARSTENGAEASPAVTRARSIAEQLRSGLADVQRDVIVDLECLDSDLAEMRDVAHRLRLIPARTVFPSLDRSVRDAAETLGRRFVFEAKGGDVRLDANVLTSLKDALMHVVRNAVAHGAETEAERTARGKPANGHVRLLVERRDARVVFVCTDDGKGIDVEAVRRAAVTRGFVPALAASSLPPDEVIALLGTGGLTTSRDVTELSGRGIGLDVVRSTTSQLKGEMSIRSEPGQGTTVEIRVPISVASLQALIVEAAGALAAIPLDAVRQALRVRESDVVRSAEGDSILHEGGVIPFAALDRILRRTKSAARSSGALSIVVVQGATRRVAIGVDRLLGSSNLVMRPLPRTVEADTAILGASLDAEGNPQLVLNPEGLVDAAERSRDIHADEARPRPAPVLIIDDSLTTRMLEQSILESAGYEVDLAVSAEEGLAKAHNRPYSLFIVDVEMPGMNGFEFVTQTKSSEALRDIPSILVTSLNAVSDRLRGEQAGALAYIVKGEFDQGQLLETIRRLIG